MGRQRHRLRASAAAVVVAAAALLVATPAAAEQAHSFAALGPLFGVTGHTDTPVFGALGAELSFVHYPEEVYLFGLGAFAQVQSVGFEHWRVAAGPQVNGAIFGMELGAFVEEGSRGHGTTVGVHAAPFVSFGFLSAAFRLGIPVGAADEGPAYGLDLGLVLTLKWAFPLDGTYLDIRF